MLTINNKIDKFYSEAKKHHFDLLVGGGDSVEIANQAFEVLKSLGLFKKNINILDFGCGFGRLAIPILKELDENSLYIGIDILPQLIEYAKNTLSSLFNNAKFFLLSDRNELYDKYSEGITNINKPITKLQEVCEGIDLIVNFSVFTHLNKKTAKKYLRNFLYILNPGGKVLISTFFINEESILNINNGYSQVNFLLDNKDKENLFFSDPINKLNGVGYLENDFIKMSVKQGFSIEHIYYGNWCGRFSRLSFQDIVILEKPQNITLPSRFNSNEYLKKNPDVKASGMNPIFHYLQYGIKEGRVY